MERESSSSSTATSNQDIQAAALLCKTGCGFFAHAAFEGMCSKCYKDLQQARQEAETAAAGMLSAAAATQSTALMMESGTNTPHADTGACMIPYNKEEGAQTSSPTVLSSTPSSSTSTAQHDISSKAADMESVTAGDAPPNLAATQTCSMATLTCSASTCSIATPAGSASSTSVTPCSAGDETKEDDKPARKNRCLTCRKKVGLTGFECRCKGIFCSTHRYSDTHDCKFDYKQLGQEQIRKNNPVVVCQKIDKL